MKILYLAPANSIHTYRYLKYLAATVDEIFLITEEEPRFDFSFCELIIKDPKTHQTARNYQEYFQNLVNYLHQLVQQIRPDLIHVHNLSNLGWIPALIDFHPLIITPWGSDLLSDRVRQDKFRARMNQISLHRADYVLADSPVLLDIARQAGKAKTELLTFGVETDKFYKLDHKEELCQKYNLPASSFIILSPRATKPIYNIELIIEAFAILRKNIKDINLLILEYNAGSPDYPAKLRKMVKQLKLEANVFFQKEVKYEELKNIYSLADLAVSVPQTDATPATFFEAMACQLPVLSIRHQSYQGIFQEDFDITYIDDFKAELLAERIRQFYNQEIDRKKIIKNALQTSQKNNFDVQMQKVLNIYEEIQQKFSFYS